MRVGFYQFDVQFGDIDANLAKVSGALAAAEADLIVLPELFATGYLFTSPEELAGFAEPYPGGRTLGALSRIAEDCGMTIVAGFPERSDGKVYNSAAVLSPFGPVTCYRKAHLFGREKLIFAPGDSSFPVVDIGPAKIGVMICFDWFFPETARTLALAGAQVICHPANLVMPHCPDAMRTRALENRVFTVTANRTGRDVHGGRELSFIGCSQIVGPAGGIVHRAGADDEDLFITEIDPAEALDKSINPYNHALDDRRRDLYRLD